MVTAKLYVEGAGPRRAQQSQCRRAFARFFESAGVKNRPGVEPCGGRKEAYDNFCLAWKTRGQASLPLLLVDAEEDVVEGRTVWQHLKACDGCAHMREHFSSGCGASNDRGSFHPTIDRRRRHR
jgi:hypothetical protein